MTTQTIKRRIRAALKIVNKEISDNAAGGGIGAGLSSEGYAGGYRDALMDVGLLLNGTTPDRRGYWFPNKPTDEPKFYETITAELLAKTGEEPQRPEESPRDFIVRLCKGVSALSDATWRNLSNNAANWSNNAISRLAVHKYHQVPALDGLQCVKELPSAQQPEKVDS